MLWIAVLGVCLALVVVVVLAAWSAKRSAREQQRLDMERRRAMPEEEILQQLVSCEYFDLSVEGRSLRSTPVVRDFLRRLEDGSARELLKELGATMTQFVEAERSIGYTGRPMLIDYDKYIRELLEELASRGSGARDGDQS
jgi:hypothetical protein